MTRTFWGWIVVLAAVALVPEQAGAQDIVTIRCTNDSLDTPGAEARIEWARRCGLQRNVGDPSFGFDTGTAAANGGNLIEYQESDIVRNEFGEGSYSGRAYQLQINKAFINTLYLSGYTYQTTDGQGFKKWYRSQSRKKARPLYPTFGTTPNWNDPTNKQLFPKNHTTDPNDCTLYTDKTFSQPATSTVYVNGYCEASCYTPEQEVLFSDGYVPIFEALNARREDMITLTPDSTLDNLKLQQNRVLNYTAEVNDALHTIYVITAESGGQLRVTSEHPVITGEGRLVQAQTLKVGEDLVKADGTPDRIVDIQKVAHFGRVYNIRPVSTELVANVLVAQGYLVGSSLFQNDEVRYINRMLLYRGAPPAETIP